MKKYISMLVLAIVVLAGCGSKGDVAEDTSNETIQVSADTQYYEWLQTVAKDFTDETGIKVDVVDAQMKEVMGSIPTAKEKAPDIFLMPNDALGDNSQKRLISPITTKLTDYSDSTIESAKVDGETYMVPLVTETSVLFYNKDLTTDIPKAMSDLAPEDWAADLSQVYMYSGLLYSLGGYFFGDDNNDSSDIGLNSDGAIETGKIMGDLYHSGVDTWSMMQEAEVAYDVSENAFQSGDVKYLIDGTWAIKSFEDAGVNFGIAPIPGWEKGQTWGQFASTKGLVLNAYSGHKDAANKFLDFINQPKYAQSLYDMTGEASANLKVKSEKGSNQEVILEAAKQSTPIPSNTDFNAVWSDLPDALIQIISGEDPKEALDAVVETIKHDIETSSYNG